jgi:5-hydroxyisourate hydrolase-like protein (transthyretin family)
MMKTNAATIIIAMVFVFFLNVVLAATSGTPIKGVIVKGGRNPGGQMLVLATTNRDGSFTIEFAEGGEYKLVFEAKSRNEFSARVNAGMELEYALTAKEQITAVSEQKAAEISRHTPFHNKIVDAQTIVVVPQGGGVIRGILRSINPSEIERNAERSIKEKGVSVKPPQR